MSVVGLVALNAFSHVASKKNALPYVNSIQPAWLLTYLYIISRNGDTYAGEYFADKMHGFGIYNFANGHRYEGAWHEGRRQGLGMYTFRNGETQSGHWQNGILDIPSTQSTTYPVSPIAVYHSKVLNVVQVPLDFLPKFL